MNKIRLGLAALILVSASVVSPSSQQILFPAKVAAQDVLCLAKNIYYESRGEPVEGQIAVAIVTVNRVKHPEQFASTVCDVVNEPYQFSWTLNKPKKIKNDKAWLDAQLVARSVLTYYPAYNNLNAHFYHTKQIKPKWSRNKEVVAVIGNHIFYK